LTSTRYSAGVKRAALDRKVSVPISMPQSLLADIDDIRGHIPRSVFVCKILHVKIKEKEQRGGSS
jgi:hypothetical protein